MRNKHGKHGNNLELTLNEIITTIIKTQDDNTKRCLLYEKWLLVTKNIKDKVYQNINNHRIQNDDYDVFLQCNKKMTAISTSIIKFCHVLYLTFLSKN